MSDVDRLSKSPQPDKAAIDLQERISKTQELLAQIKSLENGSDPIGERGVISDLQAQYNDSIAQNKSSSSAPHRDFLGNLPYELWLCCLEPVVEDNSMNMLPLTLVSRRWRDLLISSPSLWTHLYIRDNEDYTATMKLSFHLSFDRPLSVVMEIPLPIPNHPHPIQDHTNRIKELTFKRTPLSVRTTSIVDVAAMDAFYDTALDVLARLGELPMLEFLTISHGFDFYSLSMSKRFHNTPRLKGVKFWCITSEVIGTLGPNQLTYLSSSSPLEELYGALPHLPRLKRLVLTQAGDSQEDSTRIPEVNLKTLPPVEILEFYQSSPRSLYPFFKAKNSPLRELQAKLSWAEFGKLAPLLSNLISLDYLHIILKAPSSPLKGFEILLPPVKISRFELEQQPYPPGFSLPGVDKATLSALLDACRASMRKLNSFLLSVQDEVPVVNLLAMITSIKSIRKFEFKGQLTTEKNVVAEAPHIEEIILANEGLLSYLHVPNVLEVYIAQGNESFAPHNPLKTPRIHTLSIQSSLASMVDGQSYPGLINLTWLDPTGGCASIAKSFHSLKKISFDYASPRKECNDFCELLLRYPYSCRSLETIEMRAFPEWDILFCMLRRRNFLPGQGVSQISNIRLPGYPGISLLEPMTELLGGRFPKWMPSISELSLSSVDGPYFDVNVLGCEDCIDCRMTCSAPFERHSKEKMEADVIEVEEVKPKEEKPAVKGSDSREVKPLEGSDPPLPEELLKWINGWSVRRIQWYDKWNRWDGHTRRKGACERHDYSELVSITPSLLRDIPYFSHVIKWLDIGDGSSIVVPAGVKTRTVDDDLKAKKGNGGVI